ncbi:MAG: tyrosine-type recombinase/integrase [Betaproteobacteria bacterium]
MMASPCAPAGVTVENAAAFGAFAAHLATRTPHTRDAYLRDFAQLCELAGAAAVTSLERPQLMRFVATLHGRGRSGRSLARTLSAWRAFYRFVIARDGAKRDDPCAGIKAPKSARRLPSALSPEEAAKLVTIEGNEPFAVRDRALFELAYSSGLRLSELTQLDVAGCDLVTGEVRVLGKGGKERIVPVGAAARDAAARWLAIRGAHADPAERAMFTGRRGARLSPRTVQQRLAQWSIRQGLTRHVHPHMLRHSFASHVLQSSGDLRAVQEMLGHASIASTQVYTHLDFQALSKVYDAAHPRARRKRAR